MYCRFPKLLSCIAALHLNGDIPNNLFMLHAGACIVALGEKVGALYSSDDSLRHGIEAAAKRTDEG